MRHNNPAAHIIVNCSNSVCHALTNGSKYTYTIQDIICFNPIFDSHDPNKMVGKHFDTLNTIPKSNRYYAIFIRAQ